MTAPHLLAYTFGAVLGLLIAIKGLKSLGGGFAITTALAGGAWTLLKDASWTENIDKTIATVRRFQGDELLIEFTAALLIVLPATLTVASGIVFLSQLQAARTRGLDNAWAFAGRLAAVVFIYGIESYLQTVAPSSRDALQIWHERWHNINREYLRDLEDASQSGRLFTEERFRDVVENRGRDLLSKLFEASSSIQDYRLAVFRINKNSNLVTPWVSISNGNWTTHSVAPLDLNSSFLGCSIKENKLLIYPQDKSKDRAFQKRSKTRYKSFLCAPLPSDARTSPWGGISIDCVHKNHDFSENRIAALCDFARFIDILHNQVMAFTGPVESTPSASVLGQLIAVDATERPSRQTA